MSYTIQRICFWYLGVLGTGNVDEGPRSWMHNLKQLEDSSSIIRNSSLPIGINNQLVHPTRPKGRTDRIDYGLAGGDVGEELPSALTGISTLSKNYYLRSLLNRGSVSREDALGAGVPSSFCAVKWRRLASGSTRGSIKFKSEIKSKNLKNIVETCTMLRFTSYRTLICSMLKDVRLWENPAFRTC